MILITLKQIAAHSPCASVWAKILRARGKIDDAQLEQFLEDDEVPISFNKLADEEPFPLALALESNGYDDTLWALRCLPDDHRLWRKFAVWCARQVQHMMTDQRSINALEVAWRHSDGAATDDELAAAWDEAGAAARDAAWAAAWDAARDAAGAAAGAAAWAAAWAADRDAAGAAAWYAAWDAGWDAAGAAQKAKLKQILDAGHWVEDETCAE